MVNGIQKTNARAPIACSESEIVDAITSIGTTRADLVAILEALIAAGALRAQMIII